MSGERNRLPEWLNVVLASLVIIGGVIGGWQVMGESITKVNAKVESLDQRVTANEHYDGVLQNNIDHVKERVIRNEANIENMATSLDSLAQSMKDIAAEIKQTNANLNKFMIEQAKNNGSEKTNNK